MADNGYGIAKPVIMLLVLLLLTGFNGLAQQIRIRGSVYDELTRKPLKGANIRILGTKNGAAAGPDGSFVLSLDKLPATLAITCVGYENAFFDIIEVQGNSLSFYIKPVTYDLKVVDISPSAHLTMFRNPDYSVLDYELMGDKVMLLLYRNMTVKTEMALLDFSGDTLATADLPEQPPMMLYRDFLSNVHYYSSAGTAFLCHYDPDAGSIGFLYPAPIDSLGKYINPFRFRIGNRIYFQEKAINGFGTRLGYGSKDSGKVYIKKCINKLKISEFRDDMNFYYRWNSSFSVMQTAFKPPSPEDGLPVDPEFNFSASPAEGGKFGSNEALAHQLEYYNMIFPFLKINDDTLAFFDFGDNILELLDPDGKVTSKIPITFHLRQGKEDSMKAQTNSRGWQWGSQILQDDNAHKIYTVFTKNGMVKLCGIDYLTGKLQNETVIPFPFPEKIRICDKMVFFLYKPTGLSENWSLIKYRLNIK
ncbi:MAG: carboxypeptidase-like regulatory domain-containing protein [Bacteroidales bacterium]|nr:carboxypeptidase-like regulatory domain-containing protein [Bacteroidales bacterium]